MATINASPNPVPAASTACTISCSSASENAVRLKRQKNGGGYTTVAENLSGAAGNLVYEDTFSAQGDVHDYEFYAGDDEVSLSLVATLTGVRRLRNVSLAASTGNGVATTSANLKRSIPISATISCVATVTPSSTYPRLTRPMASTISCVTTIDVTSTYPRIAISIASVSAGLSSLSSLSGSPSLTKPINSVVSASATVDASDGSPSISRLIGGQSDGATNQTSSIIVVLGLLGNISGVASVIGVENYPTIERSLNGQSDGISLVDAIRLNGLFGIAGASNGLTVVDGLISLAHLLSSLSSGVSSTSSQLGFSLGLLSQSDGVTTVSPAELSRLMGVFGQSSGHATIVSTLGRLISLSVTSNGLTTLVVPLEIIRPLAGLVVGSSSASSDLLLELLVNFQPSLYRWNYRMLEQTNNTIRFYAFFSSARVGRVSLTPTVDVWNPAGSQITTDANATELGGGLYYYNLAGGSVGSEGEYVAIFKSAASGLDMNHVPALWSIGRGGIENLNFPIGSIPNISAIQSGVWSAILSSYSAAGNAAEKLIAAGAAGDPLTSQVPGAYSVNSAGWAIGRMITSAIINTYIGNPVIGSKIRIIRGDAYMNIDGRALLFTDHNNIWPTLTGATVAFSAKLKNPRLTGTTITRAGSVVVPTGNSKQVSVELPTLTTTSLLPGDENYDYDVQAILASGNPATLARGLMTVDDDVTV